MRSINYGRRRIEYAIKYGERKKTIGINILPTAQVIVLVPKYINECRIKEIIRKRARWIIEKQDYFKKMAQLHPEKELVSGDTILFLGRRYRIKVVKNRDNDKIKLGLIGRLMNIGAGDKSNDGQNREKIKSALIDWYKIKALEIIQQRINNYGALLNIRPKKILIRDQEKRWGSCSASGILRFNWRIVMAPMSVIDYVIVHELCHLKIKNHSINFWKNISLVLPDYEKRRLWLRDNVGVFRL
jgi:hypothetical protein